MKNNRAGIPRLFVVLSLALVGLITLQVMLLNYAWELKDQAFTRGAHSALAATVLALESREIEGSAFDVFFSTIDSIKTDGDFPRRVTARAMAPLADAHSISVRRGFRRLVTDTYTSNSQDSLIVVVTPESGLHSEFMAFPTNRPVALRHVVGEWINRTPKPIGERLKSAKIGELLRAELAKVGISAKPSFGVVQPADHGFFNVGRDHGGRRLTARSPGGGEDEIVMASDDITSAELLESPYRHQLFPLDPFGAPFDLVVAFPQNKIYLFWQIWPLWLASILFITVIIFAFVKAWRTNTEQRRFADQLMDFINNMTHEFKTPISTVGLAGEALGREDVRNQPEVLGRYVGMIRDENERMHRQVEKILQMARFERGDLELKQEEIALHALLRGVADSFALQIDQTDGVLDCVLPPEEVRVSGDRVHLESIFGNLIDNAVKYSPAAPQVRITVTAAGGFVEVKVSDQGKGIARENQRRVFEKYYRCPTGNLHDVKGYGLGLSFVQSLVSAHGGFVELHSLLDQGTTVTVTLPLLDNDPKETP